VIRKIGNCILILLGLSLLSLSGCNSSGTKIQLQLTDQVGRTVSMTQIPQKIVSLDPGNTEILYALGLGDKIVAVCDESDYPEEVATKTMVGGISRIDTKQVIKLKPDLVLADSIQLQKIVPTLEQAGLVVLVLNPTSIEEVEAAITLVGEATGTQSVASELVFTLSDRVKTITDVTGKLSQIDRTSVFYVMWHDPLLTAGDNTLANDVIEKAGGRNIAKDDINGYNEMSWSDAIAANPEVIITSVDFSQGAGYNASYDFITTDSSTKTLNAVQKQRVYPMWYELLDRPGPRIVDGLAELATLLTLQFED
jgi:iron complex transport system substrate-binding protein